MAGEWIPVDIDLRRKPEVQELIDLTGEPGEVICWRLVEFWGWAGEMTADGTLKATPAILARLHGGTVEFWQAVATVGWLEIDAKRATVKVPGWERRFSQAAKARAVDRMRKRAERNGLVRDLSEPCPSSVRVPSERNRTTGQERTVPPQPPREASPGEAWDLLRSAWATGAGDPWRSPNPPEYLDERLAEPGWLDEAIAAVPLLAEVTGPGRYFTRSPVTLMQFVRRGFVRKLAGGQYHGSKPKPASTPGDRPSAEEAARRWEQGSREQARRRREAEAARAGRARGADVPVAQVQTVEEPVDEEFERRRRELLAELKREAS